MENNDYGISLVETTPFGRKRIAVSNICMDYDFILTIAPSKRRCSRDSFSSGLEDLPQEILVRILCGIERDDLKSLLLVSKTMRDASLIAKQTHFAYSTPRKMAKLGNSEVETPEAPKLSRGPRRRILSDEKKLVRISVSLFADIWPLLREMETN